jgi:hypothetical protein
MNSTAARENPTAAVLAGVQHHAAEGKVVVHGRHEAAAAGFERRLGRPGAVRRVVVDVQRLRLPIEDVGRREPPEVVGANVERRVLHAERLEDALARELAERLS